MAAITDVKIETNKDEYLKELDEVIEKRILTMIGMECETAAKLLCPVDTGLLRNSITWAIAGKPANISSYSSDDTHRKTGEKVDPVKTGSYSGTSEKTDNPAVHIGSNVEYALAQETGEFGGNAHAFLRPAINDNIDHFKEIIEGELSAADPDTNS